MDTEKNDTTEPRMLRLPDGKLYPILKTVRDTQTGVVYDYAARPRTVETAVVGPDGQKTRQLVTINVTHCIPRPTKRPEPPQQPLPEREVYITRTGEMLEGAAATNARIQELRRGDS